jgi:hypothetical protein
MSLSTCQDGAVRLQIEEAFTSCSLFFKVALPLSSTTNIVEGKLREIGLGGKLSVAIFKVAAYISGCDTQTIILAVYHVSNSTASSFLNRAELSSASL